MKNAPSNVIPCTLPHLVYLCGRMREDEIVQYVALTGAEKYDPDVAAVGMFSGNGPRFTMVGKDRMPVVAGGYNEVLPGVWNSWMVGTQDGWDKNWRSITRASRWMIDLMFEHFRARRLETMALADRSAACWWYEKSLGMVYEGTRVGLGVGGEDVACYGRLAPRKEVSNG